MARGSAPALQCRSPTSAPVTAWRQRRVPTPPLLGPFQCLVWGTRSAAPARATGAACDGAAMDAKERWVPWSDGAATAACRSGSRALVAAYGKAPARAMVEAFAEAREAREARHERVSAVVAPSDEIAREPRDSWSVEAALAYDGRWDRFWFRTRVPRRTRRRWRRRTRHRHARAWRRRPLGVCLSAC